MIPKNGMRFSEKIMLEDNGISRCLQPRKGLGISRAYRTGARPENMPLDLVQGQSRFRKRSCSQLSCRSVAQPGRAPRSGRGGRRFKSCHSDHYLA